MTRRSDSPAAVDDIVVAHPSGNQFFRHLVTALRDARRLAEVCTCIDWRAGPIDALLPAALKAELGRRSFSRKLRVSVATHPLRETARLAAGRLGLRTLIRHETGPLSVDAVYTEFDQWVARRIERSTRGRVVYAYEDAAAATFATAARIGWKRIYDLPIAYWETSRRLLEDEAARWPAWEPTLLGTRDSAEKCDRKARELALADLIVCPSRFVADSLPAAARENKRVVIAPFGSPAAVNADRAAPGRDRPLRVLFAGSMSQRKGLADLFAAMKLLGRSGVQLVVMGSPVVDMKFYRETCGDFVYEPPRPHTEVLGLMGTCDVLCLPSIVEGRALVVQEAMSCGLPVIVTANTGADDAVEDDRSGFVVPIRSPEAIAAKLAWFADHREMLPEFSREARAAAARFTWSRYGSAILDALRSL